VREHLRITRSVSIPFDELAWRFSTSGGPGGQHANTSHTRAEVQFDVLASRALGPRQRELLVERLGPVVRAGASDARSQSRNRELALDRLRARLAGALHIERRRVATAPSAGARRRRVEAKRHRADVKRRRRPPGSSGDE
jgi:ribosome-associated protein